MLTARVLLIVSMIIVQLQAGLPTVSAAQLHIAETTPVPTITLLEGQETNVDHPVAFPDHAYEDRGFDPYYLEVKDAYMSAGSLFYTLKAIRPTPQGSPSRVDFFLLNPDNMTVTEMVYVDILENRHKPELFGNPVIQMAIPQGGEEYLGFDLHDHFTDREWDEYYNVLFAGKWIKEVENLRYRIECDSPFLKVTLLQDDEDLCSNVLAPAPYGYHEVHLLISADPLAEPGPYEVTFTAIDAAGQESDEPLVIRINVTENVPPKALLRAVERIDYRSLRVDADLMPLFYDPDGPLSHLEIRHDHGENIRLCDQWDHSCAEPATGPAAEDHMLYFSGPGIYDLEVTAVDGAGARSETLRLRVNWNEHVTILGDLSPYGDSSYRPFLSDGSVLYAFMRDLVPEAAHVYLIPYQGTNLTADDLEQLLMNGGIGYDLELYSLEGELFTPLCYNSLSEAEEQLVLNDCWETAYEGLGEQISLYVVAEGEVLLEKHYMLARNVTIVEMMDRYLENEQPVVPVDDFYFRMILEQLTPVVTIMSF